MLLTLKKIETLTFPKVVIPFLLALLVAFPCLSRSLRLGHYSNQLWFHFSEM